MGEVKPNEKSGLAEGISSSLETLQILGLRMGKYPNVFIFLQEQTIVGLRNGSSPLFFLTSRQPFLYSNHFPLSHV
jgi:hypothetical protein